MNKKILLVSYGGGHVNIIIPIYRELIARGHVPVVLGLSLAAVRLREESIPFYSFTNFIDERDALSLKTGEKLIANMSISNQIPVEESIAYMGVCYQELVEEYGEEEAAVLYENKGRQSFLPKKFMGRILNLIKPDIVLATNSPRSEKAMILQACNEGIPSCCVVDFYDKAGIEDRLGQAGYADKLFVPFPEMKSMLIEAGRNSADIEISGNPVFDSLASFSVGDHSRSFRHKKGWGKKFVILWVKSVFPVLQETESKVENMLLSRLGSVPSVQLVFRPHPNDASDYTQYSDSEVYISGADDSLHPLIAASDLIITINSTVGLEANLLRKLVIQVDMIEFQEKITFSLLGIGKSVESIEDLVAEIELIIANPSAQPVTSPCFEIGSSSKKIVDSIERIDCRN